MENIKKSLLLTTLNTFDLVSLISEEEDEEDYEDGDGGYSVGFIAEVNFNDSQPNPEHQVSYAVSWFRGCEQYAWFSQSELRPLGDNLLNNIANCMKCSTPKYGIIEKLTHEIVQE